MYFPNHHEVDIGRTLLPQGAYTGHVQLTDDAAADEWLRWLFPDHLPPAPRPRARRTPRSVDLDVPSAR